MKDEGGAVGLFFFWGDFISDAGIAFPASGGAPDGGGIKPWTEGLLPADDGLTLTEISQVFDAGIKLPAPCGPGELKIENAVRWRIIRSAKFGWMILGVG